MEIRYSSLRGTALDWAVATCQGYIDERLQDRQMINGGVRILVGQLEYATHIMKHHEYSPSSNYAQGGPIMFHHKISTIWDDCLGAWIATDVAAHKVQGDTQLIAAMRCYVVGKLGAVIEIPDEML